MQAKLSVAQFEQLQTAMEKGARGIEGLIENHRPRGYAHASWERMMKRLCDMGYFKPYVHGGFIVTEEGQKRYAVEIDKLDTKKAS